MPAPFAANNVQAISNGAVSSGDLPMNGFNIGGTNSVSSGVNNGLPTMSSIKNSNRKITHSTKT